MGVPKKYQLIDFTPTPKVADAARRGMRLREQRAAAGGDTFPVSVARALQHRHHLDLHDVETLERFHRRHRSMSEGDREEVRLPSAEEVDFLLAGGEAGREWVQDLRERMDAADEGSSDRHRKDASRKRKRPRDRGEGSDVSEW